MPFLIPPRVFQNLFSFGNPTQSFDFEQGSQPREWDTLYNGDVFKGGIWGFFGVFGANVLCPVLSSVRGAGLLKVLKSVH